MNLHKLIAMDTRELAVRSRQEIHKIFERMNGGGRGHNAPAIESGTPAMAQLSRRYGVSYGDTQRHFFASATERFFEGAVHPDLVQLHASLDSPCRMRYCTDIVAAADILCEDRFDLLGYRGLDFGSPIDWHLDPISGVRSPDVHWSRLKPLDRNMVGDSKVVWELNRHQWFVILGEAWLITGEDRYAEKFAGALQSWMWANPPGVGINWTSSLEVAFRAISWMWSLFLLSDAEIMTPGLFASMVSWLRLHVKYIERYLSTYFSPNTHLTGEALALFYAGVLLAELDEARGWRDTGKRILDEQILVQVREDGTHFEQAVRYHCYTVEFYLHYVVLCRVNNLPVDRRILTRLEKMVEVMLTLRKPDGRLPLMGDSDGGWLLPLVRRAPGDFSALFSTAAVLFRRGDFAWAAGGFAPESMWLLGPGARDAFDRLDPAPPPTVRQRYLKDGGYIVMRDGFHGDGHQLIYDVGVLSNDKTGAHGHADLLSVQCAAFGEDYLVDPGTGCYTADPSRRDWFRSTAAHNTLVVDGSSQFESKGPFAWRDKRARARLRCREITADYELADAEHNAWLRLPDPVVHRRRVAFVERRYWLLIDDLYGKDVHCIDVAFQFSPVIGLANVDDWLVATGPAGNRLCIRSFSTASLEQTLATGRRAPCQGWYSAEYGECVPAPACISTTSAILPVRITTLLMPRRRGEAPPPAVVFSEQAGVANLAIEGEAALEIDDGSLQCVRY